MIQTNAMYGTPYIIKIYIFEGKCVMYGVSYIADGFEPLFDSL